MSTLIEENVDKQLQIAGCCVGCGSADYTQVCDRGKPRYGPDGLYCEPCFLEADTSPFGESLFDP